jgi:hypothetical protein
MKEARLRKTNITVFSHVQNPDLKNKTYNKKNNNTSVKWGGGRAICE